MLPPRAHGVGEGAADVPQRWVTAVEAQPPRLLRPVRHNGALVAELDEARGAMEEELDRTVRELIGDEAPVLGPVHSRVGQQLGDVAIVSDLGHEVASGVSYGSSPTRCAGGLDEVLGTPRPVSRSRLAILARTFASEAVTSKMAIL